MPIKVVVQNVEQQQLDDPASNSNALLSTCPSTLKGDPRSLLLEKHIKEYKRSSCLFRNGPELDISVLSIADDELVDELISNDVFLVEEDEASLTEEDLKSDAGSLKVGGGSLPSLSSINYNSVATEHFLSGNDDSELLLHDSTTDTSSRSRTPATPTKMLIIPDRTRAIFKVTLPPFSDHSQAGETLPCLNPVMSRQESDKNESRWEANFSGSGLAWQSSASSLIGSRKGSSSALDSMIPCEDTNDEEFAQELPPEEHSHRQQPKKDAAPVPPRRVVPY